MAPKKSTKALPAWLTVRGNGVVAVDPDQAYPAVLGALLIPEADYDQYWIETAYQCAKLAAQEIILGSEYDPRPKVAGGPGSALVILIEGGAGRKDRWALANFQPGRGVVAATKGREAKMSYAKIRGALLA